MNVYLAGRFSRREELRKYALELEEFGIKTKARWLTDPNHRLIQSSNKHNQLLADHDFEDVAYSNATILFTAEEQGARGGMWVELGLALAWRKPVFIVGPYVNVFTYRGEVSVFPSWEAFKKAIMQGLVIGGVSQLLQELEQYRNHVHDFKGEHRTVFKNGLEYHPYACACGETKLDPCVC